MRSKCHCHGATFEFLAEEKFRIWIERLSYIVGKALATSFTLELQRPAVLWTPTRLFQALEYIHPKHTRTPRCTENFNGRRTRLADNFETPFCQYLITNDIALCLSDLQGKQSAQSSKIASIPTQIRKTSEWPKAPLQTMRKTVNGFDEFTKAQFATDIARIKETASPPKRWRVFNVTVSDVIKTMSSSILNSTLFFPGSKKAWRIEWHAVKQKVCDERATNKLTK